MATSAPKGGPASDATSAATASSGVSNQNKPAEPAAPTPNKTTVTEDASANFHTLSTAYQTYLRHDPIEQQHCEDVCRAYRQYATFATSQWTNVQNRLLSLTQAQRDVLPAGLRNGSPEFALRTKAFKEAAIRNQFCLDCILRHMGLPHSQEIRSDHKFVDDSQISKVSSVLKSLARDWSLEGKVERDAAYIPILQQVQQYVPVTDKQHPPRISVPGAGVGRLACEICSLGYEVQGNEFSLYMLFASDYILNGPVASPTNSLKISPYLLESRNVHWAADTTRAISIPDADSFEMMEANRKRGIVADFSMAAGEFISIYNVPREEAQWDAVVACFFLDASPSIAEYAQTIFRMLKVGGVLINFGPLLWHWSGPLMRPDDKTFAHYHQRYDYLDSRYLTSVDLCWEDVRSILINVGFAIVTEETGKEAYYTSDRKSMMRMSYRCVNFVARKEPEQETVETPKQKVAETKTADPYVNTDPTQTSVESAAPENKTAETPSEAPSVAAESVKHVEKLLEAPQTSSSSNGDDKIP